MSHLLLVLFTSSFHISIGGSGGHPSFWYWEVRCFSCYWRVQGIKGVFCANFSYYWRGWPICQECFHGDFFSANPDRETYYYGLMKDVEGIPWNSNPKDELRYKHLTNCVHMFMPFLVPTCHLCNLQYRLSTSSPKYRVFMMHITRYILDAGWGGGNPPRLRTICWMWIEMLSSVNKSERRHNIRL